MAELPPPEPLVRRAIRRVREWGGPELYRVTFLFVLGLCVGSAYGMTEPGYTLGERILNRIRSIPATELPPPAPPAPEPSPKEDPSSPPAPVPSDDRYVDLWKVIFLHNLRAAGAAAIGGLLTQLIPLGVSLLNGTVLGLCCVVIVAGDGLSFPQLILLLGPHGVFELPAMLLAGAIGVRLTRVARQDPRPGARWRALGNSWRELAVVTVLLLLAAA